MLFRKISWLSLSVFLLTLSGALDVVESKTSQAKSKQPKQKLVKIEGFRSAKFGMREKDIYKAITRDFKISKRKIVRKNIAIEKTTSLEIVVPDLMQIGGSAKIVYILGFKSKKLMQVNIIWGKENGKSGKNASTQDIVDTANFLRKHLIKKTYVKDGFTANTRMNDVVTIVFRGKDKKGRMVLLVLNTPKVIKGEKQIDASLKLSYMLDPENPDILTIKEDDF